MDTVIKFRADSSEREQFELAAKKAGQTLSKWARVNLVRAALGAPDVFTHEEVVVQPPLEDRTVGSPQRAKLKNYQRAVRPDPEKDTRSQQERMDDFYRANMAKGKK